MLQRKCSVSHSFFSTGPHVVQLRGSLMSFITDLTGPWSWAWLSFLVAVVHVTLWTLAQHSEQQDLTLSSMSCFLHFNYVRRPRDTFAAQACLLSSQRRMWCERSSIPCSEPALEAVVSSLSPQANCWTGEDSSWRNNVTGYSQQGAQTLWQEDRRIFSSPTIWH